MQRALLAVGLLLLLAAAGCRKSGPAAPPPAPPAPPPGAAARPPPRRPGGSPPAPRGGKEAALTLRLADKEGKPVAGRSVSFDITMPGKSLAPNRPMALPMGPGEYQARAVFPRSGDWVVRARISGLENADQFTFHVKAK